MKKEVTIAIIGAVAAIAASLINTLLKLVDNSAPKTANSGMGSIFVEQKN